MKDNFLLFSAFVIPVLIFVFTLGRYYGFYYDNHYFNLLALDLMQGLRPWLYLGSHYTIHSSLYSWLVLPLFYIFGPADFSMELLSSIFHLGTILLCFKLGEKFFSRSIGIIFAFLVSVAPIYLVNIYTWPECSLIAFLNLAAIYYFLAGFQEGAKQKVILSGILFCLSCSQSIYSIALLPVFLIYAVWNASSPATRHGGLIAMTPTAPHSITLRAACYLAVIAAASYLIFLIEAMYIGRAWRALYYGAVLLSVFAAAVIFSKLSAKTKSRLSFNCLFFVITATALLLLDLFVQLDMNFFAQRFGYYRDTTFAGGFGVARPPFTLGGAPLAILGRPLYLSVLTSLFAFGSLYSRISFNLWEFFRTMFSYYKECFPAAINIFFIIGITGLLSNAAGHKYRRVALKTGPIFALSWLLGITFSFFNSYPQHILRIYILPMPYFIAALGVYYSSKAAGYVFKGRRSAFALTAFALVSFLSYKQLIFSKGNIYDKYGSDKSRSNYFRLFYGWPYGRSYKEAGEFLLKDAPLKDGRDFRSIFIYTIAADTAQGICSLFFNNIDWYTRNKIKILYDTKPISRVKYGSKSALAAYLKQLFTEHPAVQAVYFADFYDTKDNFSFFSKMHPDIRPYKIVNDDNGLDYDCILYKFERNIWQGRLGY